MQTTEENEMDMGPTFIKLGGSLITDKRREATARPELLRTLAQEIKNALESDPEMHLLLGHGSGSFGHWEASRYGTRHGVTTPEGWQGFAQVSTAASRLNRIVADTFQAVGLPVLSLQPSASALAEEGNIVTIAIKPIQHALQAGLIPLIFGDVAFDRAWGGTILSTEDLFVHLATILHPDRILLLGNSLGVLDNQGQVIPVITPQTYADIVPFLQGSGGVDVTGGMAEKVKQMVMLVQQLPDLQIWILSGEQPGTLQQALLHPEQTPGTLIKA